MRCAPVTCFVGRLVRRPAGWLVPFVLLLASASARVAHAEIVVQLTDGVDTVVAGTSVTYKLIVFSNDFASVVNVFDDFPSSLSCAWTCALPGPGGCGAPSGSGDIAMSLTFTLSTVATITATCQLSPATSPGTLQNTVFAVCAGGECTDSDPQNNSDTDTNAVQRRADLEVTVDDGVTTVVAGTPITYEITATNHGPSNSPSTQLNQFLTGLSGCSWICTDTGGASCPSSGTGSIGGTVNLPVGGTVAYLASCAVLSSATSVVNDFFATPSGGVDPVPGNEIATDTNLVARVGDLRLVMTDGVATAIPGTTTTYAIAVANDGPSDVNARVSDAFAPSLTCTWTCLPSGGGSCPSSGSGTINHNVAVPYGGSVTFSATCAISRSAVGTLANTASVTPVTGVTDPDSSDNIAVDVDTLQPTADLWITNSDGAATATPGEPVTYTLVARNDGPSNVGGVVVHDAFPPALVGCTWSCTGSLGGGCAAAGLDDIHDTTVSLPAGASVTYTALCSLAADATGTLANTATVTTPVTVLDPGSGNNAAVDLDILTPKADLAITKTDGVVLAVAGGSLTYTVVASNAGPSDADGAMVQDFLPAALTCGWTCVGAAGGGCPASGVGSLTTSVHLPADASVTFVLSCAVGSGGGLLVNTATVTPPAGVTDGVPANGSATDVDTFATFVFGSSFESGDLGEWSGDEPPTLLGGASAALAGHEARFTYDLASLPGREILPSSLAALVDADGRTRYGIEVRRADASAPLEVRLVAYAGETVASAWLEVAERPQELAVEWRPGSPGESDGTLALTIEGRLAAWLDGLPATEPASLRLRHLRNR